MNQKLSGGSKSGVWDGELNQPSFTITAAPAAPAAAASATFGAMKSVKPVQASGCAM